ncbi:MAG: hypothetical protein J5671_09895 [Bacteroidaceae bacterium]|nr:hypothetical protein [Bacteroidaceae bacterium]
MKKMLTMALLLMCTVSMNAQKSQVPDKEIIGTWIMESMQWEGEKVIKCGKEKGYTQFKYYGPDGEYACAEIVLKKDGQLVIYPHEYGTYSFKDGWYVEMGRPTLKDAVILTDKNTYKGTWFTRHDIWKKVTLPDKVTKCIVDRCKMKDTSDDEQQLIKQHMFK